MMRVPDTCSAETGGFDVIIKMCIDNTRFSLSSLCWCIICSFMTSLCTKLAKSEFAGVSCGQGHSCVYKAEDGQLKSSQKT